MARATVDLQSPPPKPEPAVDYEDIALGEDYALTPRYVEMVVDAVDRADHAQLAELVRDLHPADVADLMGFLSAEYREELIPALSPEALPEILAELDDNIREEVLEHVEPAVLARALGELESDDAADVVEDLEEDKRDAVLAAMSDTDRAAIESSLAYDEETAGRLMQREVLAAPQFWTVEQTIAHVRQTAEDLPELFFDVYVVDPAFKPIGALAVSQLLKAHPDATLSSLMESVTEIPVDMDQEEVAYIFDKYHLISAPVTDAGGRLVGQITVDDIVGVIQEEAEEDILALAQVSDAGRDAGLLDIVKTRLPWLITNLFTEAVAVTSISFFQEEVAKVVALAVLMPIVSSVGGNAGTQTLAVAVRALASKELNSSNASRIIWREIAVAILNGVSLAVVMGLATWGVYHNPRLAITVALALVANIFTAGLGGILAPLLLERLGRDPAVSSPILVTFLTDFMGFFAVLAIAALILL